MKASLFFPLFLLFFQLIKERDGHKRAYLGGIWRWARGNDAEESSAACLVVWMPRWLRGNSRPWPVARRRTDASELPWRGSGSRPLPRPFCLIGVAHRALARGAAVDEVLPPSGLVADMVVGVCLESVHYHECQHACFNQEPSSITNTALLNGKTFPRFHSSSFLFLLHVWLEMSCLGWLYLQMFFSGLFFFLGHL